MRVPPPYGNSSQAPDSSPPSAPADVRVDVSGLSHPGKVRPRNEDHFLVMRIGRYLETVVTSLPPEEMKARTDEVGHVMIVADGMGGHAGGEQASRMAITGLVKLALARPDWIFRLDDGGRRGREAALEEEGSGSPYPAAQPGRTGSATCTAWERR